MMKLGLGMLIMTLAITAVPHNTWDNLQRPNKNMNRFKVEKIFNWKENTRTVHQCEWPSFLHIKSNTCKNQDYEHLHCLSPEDKFRKLYRTKGPYGERHSSFCKSNIYDSIFPPGIISLKSKQIIHRFINIHHENDLFCKFKNTPKIISDKSISYVEEGGRLIKLGSGKFGKVYIGNNLVDGSSVAIKITNKDESDFHHVLMEGNYLQSLNHTHALPYFYGLLPLETSEDYFPLAIITEYVGDIDTYGVMNLENLAKNWINETILSEISSCPLDDDLEWFDIFITIARNLRQINGHGLVLNDIKTDNIVLHCQDGLWMPYVIDVGLAKPVGSFTPFDPETVKYDDFLAPELIDKELMHNKLLPVSPASDVFSYGRMLEDVAKIITSLYFRLKPLIDKCVNLLPSDRPDWTTIITALQNIKEGHFVVL